jgi:hypothetical protein
MADARLERAALVVGGQCRAMASRALSKPSDSGV